MDPVTHPAMRRVDLGPELNEVCAAISRKHRLNPVSACSLAQVVANQIAYSGQRVGGDDPVQLAFTTSDIVLPFSQALPVILQAFPALFAQSIADVQPLNQPTGKVFFETYARETFSTFLNATAANAATDLYLRDARGFYVGDQIQITKDDASVITRTISAIVGDRVTVSVAINGQASYGNAVVGTSSSKPGSETGRVKKGKLTWTSQTISAIRRILQAEWSLTVQEDMQAQFGDAADARMTNAVAQDVLREIDNDLIATIVANNSHAGNVNWAAAWPGAGAGYPDITVYNKTLVNALLSADKLVQDNRFRPTTYLLCNPADALRLTSLNNFVMADFAQDGNPGQLAVNFLGTLSGLWKVYSTSQVAAGKIWLGREKDGIAYLPYIFLAAAPAGGPVYNTSDDTLSRNIRTRDAMAITIPKAFATVTIT